jgi:hypothetical protein
MADPIELRRKLRSLGWKVKVYSRERLEPPHLTLICRARFGESACGIWSS